MIHEDSERELDQLLWTIADLDLARVSVTTTMSTAK